MSNGEVTRQAEALVSMLPRLARGLFTIDTGDPAMELPIAQMRVCSILREGPRSMSALACELGISHSAMTQVADRLERSRYVERVAETADRRAKSLQLTPHGAKAMRRRYEKRLARVLQVIERLDPETRERAVSALEALLDACASPGPQAGDPALVAEPALS